MNRIRITGLLALLACRLTAYPADYYDADAVVTTYAGSGFSGLVNGTGTMTMFNRPQHIAVGSQTNVIVWDENNHRFRKIDENQVVTTFAGNGINVSGANSRLDGQGEGAQFGFVIDICALPNGNFAVADGNWIRLMTAQGAVSTLVGAASELSASLKIAADSGGNVFVADDYKKQVFKVDPAGGVALLAGSGNIGLQDGTGIFTSFSSLRAVAINAANDIFVLDFGQPTGEAAGAWLRRITQDGQVTTLFPTFGWASREGRMGAAFLSDGNLTVFADTTGFNKYAVSAYQVTGGEFHIAGGGGLSGYADGPVSQALFLSLGGMAVGPDGNLYLSDIDDHRIRKITFGTQPQPAPVALTASLLAGVTIKGKAGLTYSVEATETPEDQGSWTEVARIALPVDDYMWVDRSSPGIPKRFYRATMIR